MGSLGGGREVLGEAVVPIRADSRGLDRDVSAAEATLRRRMQSIGQSAMRMGANLTRRMSLPIVAGLGAMAKGALGFEEELSKVVGLVGVSQSQVDQWGRDILQMAPRLGKAPRELAEGLFFVTSAGFRGAEAMDVLEASAKASAAGLGETAAIADAVTSAINAYGAENLDATQATDILTAAVREGKLEADTLAPVLGRLLPIASELGVSFDQVAGFLAAASRTGLDANEAATALRGTMSTLLKPSAQAEETLAEFGLSAEGVRRQLREEGLLATLRTLEETFGDNEEAMARVFPNVRGLSGVLNILGQDGEVVDGVFEGVANSTGDMDRAFEVAEQTGAHKLRVAMETLRSAGIELGQVVAERVVPWVERLGQWIGRAADAFREADPAIQGAFLALVGGLAAAGPLLWAAGAALSGIAVLLSPAGLLLAGLGTLAWVFREPLMEAMGKAREFIEERVLPVFGRVRDFIDEVIRPAFTRLGRTTAEETNHTADSVESMAERAQRDSGFMGDSFDSLAREARRRLGETGDSTTNLADRHHAARERVEADSEAMQDSTTAFARRSRRDLGHVRDSVENLATNYGTSAGDVMDSTEAMAARIKREMEASEGAWEEFVTNVNAWVNDTLIPAFRRIRTWWDENEPEIRAKIRSLADSAVTKLGEWQGYVVDTLVPAFREAAGDITEDWEGMSSDVIAAVQELLDFWNDDLKPALDDLKENHGETLEDMATVAGFAFRAMSFSAGNWLRKFARDIRGAIQIAGTLMDAYGRLRESAERMWQGIENVFQFGVEKVRGWINNLIDFVNPILDFVGLGQIRNLGPTGINPRGVAAQLPGRNEGGPIPGPPGPDEDSVLIRATPGEHMWTRQEVAAAGGHSAMERWRKAVREGKWRNAVPPGMTAAQAHWGGDESMPGLAAFQGLNRGGTVNPSTAGGRGVASVLAAVRNWVGRPYRWGGVGPGGFDCSGLVSAAHNVAVGTYAHRRRYATASFAPGRGAGGTRAGLGSAFGIGVRHGNPGHMSATVGGTNIEATPPRVRMGAGARGARHPMYTMHFHVPQVGGQFVGGAGGDGGGVFDRLFSRLSGLIDNITGRLSELGDHPFGKMLSTLTSRIVQGVTNNLTGGATAMAAGGIVTRPTRALIGEAGPEAVIPLDRLERILFTAAFRATQFVTPGSGDITPGGTRHDERILEHRVLLAQQELDLLNERIAAWERAERVADMTTQQLRQFERAERRERDIARAEAVVRIHEDQLRLINELREAEQRRHDNFTQYHFDQMDASGQLKVTLRELQKLQPWSDEWTQMRRDADRLAEQIHQRELDRAADLGRERDAAHDRLVSLLAERDRIQERMADAQRRHAQARQEAEERFAEQALAAQRRLADESDRILSDRRRQLTEFARLDQPASMTFGQDIESLIRNAQDQTDRLQRWGAGLDELRDMGLDDAVIQALGLDVGPEALHQIERLRHSSLEQIERYNAAVADRTQEATKRVAHEQRNMLGEVGRGLAAAQQAFADETAEMRAELSRTLANLDEQLRIDLAEMTLELQAIGQDQGLSFAEAIAEGLLSGIPGIMAAAREVQKAMRAASEAQARADASQPSNVLPPTPPKNAPSPVPVLPPGHHYRIPDQGRTGHFLRLLGPPITWYEATGSAQVRELNRLYGSPGWHPEIKPSRFAGNTVQGLFQSLGGWSQFDQGGELPPGLTMAWNGTGRAEYILRPMEAKGGDDGWPVIDNRIFIDGREMTHQLGPHLVDAIQSRTGVGRRR